MRLSIITINYNGSENTIGLLKSLAGQTDKDFQVIVVDNASDKEDLTRLSSFIAGAGSNPEVLLVRNDRNLGFSGGNNVGIKMALNPSAGQGSGRADWVFLLNNDTWVEEGFIGSLKAILSQKRGILGLPMDEGQEVAYGGRIRWLSYPRGSHIRKFSGIGRGDNIYAIGGGMLISGDTISQIGLLDENYFLYFEDMDYSVRARKAGVPIEILEKPIVHHNASSSTKKLGSPTILRYHYRNAFYFNFKNGPWFVKILVWPWSFWVMKKQLLKLMLQYRPDESLAILRGVIDFYKGRMGKIL